MAICSISSVHKTEKRPRSVLNIIAVQTCLATKLVVKRISTEYAGHGFVLGTDGMEDYSGIECCLLIYIDELA